MTKRKAGASLCPGVIFKMDRLTQIFNCIQKSTVAADVGCDHGKLEALLIGEKKADKVIATDISEKSLHKAARLCESLGIGHKVDFRQGDGFSVVNPGEADTIVIAGMGGNLISDILNQGMDTAKTARLVLCPHTHEGALRRFLCLRGFRITEECLSLEEGRYYQIICAEYDGGSTPDDDFYYEIGRKLLESKDALLPGFLEYKIRIARGIIENARLSAGEDAKKLVLDLSRFIKRLEECFNVCKHEND